MAFLFVQRPVTTLVIVTLTMESLILLVCKVPVDDANDHVLEVLRLVVVPFETFIVLIKPKDGFTTLN